jgi:Xaa-Pro dipeptidase
MAETHQHNNQPQYYTDLSIRHIEELKLDRRALHGGNRIKVLNAFRADPSISATKSGLRSIALLRGGVQTTQYDSDTDLLFRQESNFQYLFGANLADCLGVLELDTGIATLFIPKLPAEYAVWYGTIHKKEYFQEKFQVDEVLYVEDLPSYLKTYDPTVVYIAKNVNGEEALHPLLTNYRVDNGRLKEILDEARLIKTSEEIKLLKFINKISSWAHVEVMKSCRPGMKEYELEALFLHAIYSNGRCRRVSYCGICGCGKNGATLHYPNNNKDVLDGQMALLDMGAEYHCYTSDITCSFPVNGKFTENQKVVYNIVLAAQQAVMNAMAPGVKWEDMHRLADRVIVEGLLQHGFLKGSVEDLVKNQIGGLFFPHGLGHFMGLDTHDVGGYPKGVERIQERGIKSLRARRVLEAGMVLTVEPGLYFIEAVLRPAFEDPAINQFLVKEKIEKFLDFGGVRLEDDVIVTETGIENMTIAPRTVEEIEEVMTKKTHPKFTLEAILNHH